MFSGTMTSVEQGSPDSENPKKEAVANAVKMQFQQKRGIRNGEVNLII